MKKTGLNEYVYDLSVDCIIDVTDVVDIYKYFICHLFMVSLDRRNESCNTLDDPSGGICVLNKTENVNLNLMIKNAIQMKIQIKMCVDVSVKNQ